MKPVQAPFPRPCNGFATSERHSVARAVRALKQSVQSSRNHPAAVCKTCAIRSGPCTSITKPRCLKPVQPLGICNARNQSSRVCNQSRRMDCLHIRCTHWRLSQLPQACRNLSQPEAAQKRTVFVAIVADSPRSSQNVLGARARTITLQSAVSGCPEIKKRMKRLAEARKKRWAKR
jgi:hypothetical protein